VTDLAVSHGQGILDQPGTIAFLVIFGMGVILFFVFRSMAKHLRKIQMAARAEAEAAAATSGAAGSDEPESGQDAVTGAEAGTAADTGWASQGPR